LFELALNKELKTKSTWKDQYGLSIQGIYEYCTSNFYIMFIWQIVSIILGALVSSLFT